jgi:outer membrane protein assembly factor BamB
MTLDGKSKFIHTEDDAKGVLAETELLNGAESPEKDLTRRIHALHLAASDKLLLCPTHLGAVIAVKRADHKVAWTARYGKLEDKRFENYSSTWLVTSPLVADNLVLYAPPDAEALFAFDLADGSVAWKRERGNGVFPAGLHKDKLVIVASDAVIAVNIADGKEIWKLPFTGTLTGKGVLHGDRYYLPLGLGTEADKGEVQAIDLKQGKAIGVLKRPDAHIFGNLLIHRGKLISQTFESLSVFELP